MGDDDFGLLLTVFLWVYGFLSPVGGWRPTGSGAAA